MTFNWYHADWQKLTTQRVRQIVTIGLPELILPEHVAGFGIIPFVNTPQPEITNLQNVVDDGLEITATEASQKWSVVNKFETVAEEAEYLESVFVATRESRQNNNKEACTAHILGAYPDPIQRSAALGVYPQAKCDAIRDFVANCVEEENRVFALLEAATTMAELEAIESPTWPEA